MNPFNDNEIFRAFAPSKNKSPLVPKYKGVPDDELPSFEDIDLVEVEEAVGFLSEDYMIVDVDDEEQSDILLKIIDEEEVPCLVVQTTRGKHFYFKNSENGVSISGIGKQSAVGITVDYKLGMKNGTATIKRDGRFREVIRQSDQLVEVPKWLHPIKTDIDFFELGEGDGRNDILFTYILTLQREGFTKEDIKETITIINDYILPDSLDETELNTILRDEAFQKPVFFKKNAFLHDKFGDYLRNEHKIKRINGQLHIYENGVYIANIRKIEQAMLKYIPSLNRGRRSEVLAYLEIQAADNEEPSPPNYLLFRNGVLDVLTGNFEPNNPDFIITNRIPWDYNVNAYDALADKTLEKIACGDSDIRALLEEGIGATFYRSNDLAGGSAFILTGEKSNGKSTYLAVLVKILGEDNIVALDLNELGERFKTAELFGKLANIGDDIDSEYIKNTGVFKKLVTGERLNVERKGSDPFDFNSYAKLMFSANEMPRFGRGGDTAAISRRLIMIPFDAKFSKDDPDYNPYIKTDLQKQEPSEYFIKLGVEGLQRVLKNKQFTTSKKVQDEVERYELENDNVKAFLDEVGDIEELLNEPTEDVYLRYSTFCSANQYYAVTKNKFSRRFAKMGIITKPVKGKRVYDYK